MRAKLRPRIQTRLHGGLTMMLACLVSKAYGALVTTCPAGFYLVLDESNLIAREGVCATCPRGKSCSNFIGYRS